MTRVYVITCPNCGHDHPLFWEPFEDYIFCPCGCILREMEETIKGVSFRVYGHGPARNLTRARYEQKHDLDDRSMRYAP